MSLAGGIWEPWHLSLLRAVFARIGAVVGAAVVIGVGHNWPRWLLFPVAVVVGCLVFWVWRKTRKRRKQWYAYLVYTLAIIAGIVLLTSNSATRDLGVPPPVAVFGGLGAMLAGYAGLVSIARGSSRVRHRSAIRVEIAAIVLAAVLALGGLLLLERWKGSNPVPYVMVTVAALTVYVALSLLSESLIRHVPVMHPGEEPGEAEEVAWVRETPQRLHRSSWLWPVGALVILAGVVVWLIVVPNINPWIVLGVTVGLLLLFFAVAADGIADIAAVLVVVSLAWSLAPRTEVFDAAPLAAGQTILVALGDSYTSGEGATKFYDGTNNKGANECRRASSAYAPELVERDTEPDLTGLVFLACSGAKAANMDGRVQYDDEPIGSPARLRDNGIWDRGATQLEQLDEVLRAVRPRASDPTEDPEEDLHGLVVLSLGGNDAGFGTIASSCVGLGDCGEVVDAWTADLQLVGSRLDRAYAALRGVIGPSVPVLVVPYPVPLDEQRCDISLMTQSEHTSLRGFVEQLNGEVERAASRAGFDYLDIQPAFEGHRICDGHDPSEWYLNFIATNPTGGSFQALSNPRNWFHNSFHPNAKGHDAIAGAVEGWISGHADEIARSRFQLADSPFRVAYVEDEQRPSEALEQIGSGSCAVSGEGWESRWTVCESAQTLQRLLVPAVVFVLAAWVLAFTLLHLYRRWTDPAGQGVTTTLPSA